VQRKRHSEVQMATEADTKDIEERYGQSLDELVAEAERGYDVSKMQRRLPQ
jgi:hypothetical protein